MDKIAVIVLIILSSALFAIADTYTWTDNKGVVNFTDDPAQIPTKYRKKVKTREDITTRNPKVRQELKEQEEKARREENHVPRVAAPDHVPSPPAPVVTPEAASDELPPGRPKSQRIRENIERREAEEKAKQLEDKK